MVTRKIIINLSFLIFLGGCSATRHASNIQKGTQGDGVTVGTVQREIRKGMSGAEVLKALGSPNIISIDEQGREVWVYDKIATDRVVSKGSGAFILLGYGGTSGASSTSQRTLTIIIKFNHEKMVRDFAYHTSRF
mmetsp:Transcript_15312/g.7427  ORF Transcript_15312/g.7427 Transcript_15312/m.7427 type:complete len:135 (+) Transcript_15312:96-500(+)